MLLKLERFRRSIPFVNVWTTRSAVLASLIVHGAIVGTFVAIEMRGSRGGENAPRAGRPERPTELTMETPEMSPSAMTTEFAASPTFADELPSDSSTGAPDPTPPSVTTTDELRTPPPSRPDLLQEIEVTPHSQGTVPLVTPSSARPLASRRPKEKPTAGTSTEPPIALAAKPPQNPQSTASVSVPPSPSGGDTAPASPRIRARPDPAASPKPIYPAKAEKKGIGGRVLLRVQVNHEGVVTSVVVSESSGHSILDDAAVAAVKKWRFLPAEENGQKIATTTMVPIRFDPKL